MNPSFIETWIQIDELAKFQIRGCDVHFDGGEETMVQKILTYVHSLTSHILFRGKPWKEYTGKIDVVLKLQ